MTHMLKMCISCTTAVPHNYWDYCMLVSNLHVGSSRKAPCGNEELPPSIVKVLNCEVSFIFHFLFCHVVMLSRCTTCTSILHTICTTCAICYCIFYTQSYDPTHVLYCSS
jgi:hypothetical protein